MVGGDRNPLLTMLGNDRGKEIAMRILLLAAIACFHFAAQGAQAGAWLREKGASFTSFSFSSSWFQDASSSAYMEFGITETSTVGIDIGLSRNQNGKKLAYGTLFLRRALGAKKGPNTWAYEVGLGATYGGAGTEALPHFKTGLSFGRGINFQGKGGWLAADAAVLWGLQKDNHVAKLDTTLGLNFNDRLAGMVQLNFAHQEGETFSYFEPSLVINPRDTGLKLQIGLITPLDDAEKTALKLGLWHEF